MQDDRCTVRLQMRVPRDIADDLDAIASDLGLTRSAALRFLVRSMRSSISGRSPLPMGGTTTRPLEINDHERI